MSMLRQTGLLRLGFFRRIFFCSSLGETPGLLIFTPVAMSVICLIRLWRVLVFVKLSFMLIGSSRELPGVPSYLLAERIGGFCLSWCEGLTGVLKEETCCKLDLIQTLCIRLQTGRILTSETSYSQ